MGRARFSRRSIAGDQRLTRRVLPLVQCGINGPLKFAQLRLYFSSGKTAWNGKTDKDGMFTIAKMPPGHYRLVVRGWGRTTVQLNPELDRRFVQIPVWNLWFTNV